MALSKSKKDKITRDKRQNELNKRSLNGKGYWMDGLHEYYANQYLNTGDESYLNHLPDYREFRKSN